MNKVTKKWLFLKTSSIVLIPLMLWFIVNFVSIFNKEYGVLISFFSDQSSKFLFSIFLVFLTFSWLLIVSVITNFLIIDFLIF